MKAVEPVVHEGATLIVFARNQPEYQPLPASVDSDGLVMTEWEPSEEELARLLVGGRIRLWIHGTDVEKGRPFTPLQIEVIEPECGFQTRES